MPFIPVPNTAQFRVQFTYNGEQCENVYHVRHTGVWTVADLFGTTQVFKDWHSSSLALNQPIPCTLTRVIARDLSSFDGTTVEDPCSTACNGLVEGAEMPGNVTLAIKWITGLAGRSQRGRTYHIGLVEGDVVGNIVSPGRITALSTSYQSLITRITAHASDQLLVVVSRFHNKVPRLVGVTTPIVGAIVENRVDSQRRRLAGRGS